LVANRQGETEYGRNLVRKLQPKLVKNLGAAKIKVCEMDEKTKDVFAKKTKSVHKMFRKRSSAKGKKLLDLVEKNR
jgi:TRAP-type C4-dicarboxylate transport system substrate-binding protein